jgi:acyl-CoA synthetase (AMP-forming)/AMP-acid ligase II
VSLQNSALPIGTSWWELIDARANLTPDRMFLSDERGRSLSFAEYRDAAERTAAGLVALGFAAKHVVSWQLPSTLEAAVLMAALSRLGIRQNPILPILRESEVGLITNQLQSRWIIVPGTYRGFDHPAMASKVVPVGCSVLDLSEFEATTHGIALPSGDPASLAAARSTNEERWNFYSSGTTAIAKGARHTDRSAMSSSIAQIELIHARECEVFPVAFPISHVGGIMVLTAYLRVGARVALMDGFDPATTPQSMADCGATILGSATPFFHSYLAAQSRQPDTPMFAQLHQLQAGGAPISVELNAECQRVFGMPIINQWGLTEFPSATSLSPDDAPEKFANGSVGRLVPGASLKVVGTDGQLVPDFSEGELWVNGPQRMLGYVDATLDAGVFDADGYFRTGDLGRMDTDGFVFITGRLKDIIIRNAENLSAVEIEGALSSHPAIADVAVIPVADQRTGERACAVVVVRAAMDAPTLSELAMHCASLGLAKQKTPEQLEFVDALPRNLMGKVLKHELRARFR